MSDLQLTQVPWSEVGMLIRKHVESVFDAFTNQGTARVAPGRDLAYRLFTRENLRFSLSLRPHDSRTLCHLLASLGNPTYKQRAAEALHAPCESDY